MQSSDDKDQQFNVWHDIFLDNVNLHVKFERDNHYGPVLFKFDIEILKDPDLPPIWITKDNPTYWTTSQSKTEHYFQTIEEFTTLYQNGNHEKMITLRFANNSLPFEAYLEEIIIDDPDIILNGVNLLGRAVSKLKSAAENMGSEILEKKGSVRECSPNCYCRSNYYNERDDKVLTRRFLVESEPCFFAGK